jgi:hydroxymethylpyrimidine/phosphomethylpyrimidine kinase
MVASSGDRLLDQDAEQAVAERLVPLAALVTPNTHEAAILTGLPVRTPDDLREAARALVERGAGAALIKGGHLEGAEAVDLFWDGREERVWRRARLATRHTHGTGCTLSAAATAGLAHGRPLVEAVDAAVDFVARAIASAPGLGTGHGPVNHFVPAVPARPAG